ncbi:hypothetical protein SASPL_137554 [Salvia splendens]|uniref:NERD domain-containing protein n=1 Tax=Salvia splendens TaxID=180675 RepID=A0A8X8ZDI0_SALSN|nr:uncharacterized protein LOC121764025 [Salvia splendens]KAG6400712.1 hypothetical protein SASPL_137554 [Salvia splendens]
MKLTMFAELICGLVFYRIFKRFFFDDDAEFDLDSSRFNALTAVAKRLEKLYAGSKVYVGLQIPDPDSASRKNIDLVLVTNHEAIVISVKNVSGFVSVDKDGNWVCTDKKHRRTDRLPNPVPEIEHLVSILEGYLEQRGVALPEGYLSYKVICPDPNFCQSVPFPPEVITYGQWTQLKPEHNSSYSGWIKGALFRGKKSQESFSEKLNSVLCTAPACDRLEVKGNKCILGEFLEFKGKQEDLRALRKIKRSKVSHMTFQKTSMFSFVHSEVQVLYALCDYRVEGPSWSSQWKEVAVRSSTEVLFRPQNSTRLCKYKLSTITSISLSV